MGEGVVLGQLHAFLEIARLGSVTRAADSLFLTQPALTSRLKRLEREVGAALVVRDRRGARLTDAGRAFLPYADAAVTAMTEAQNTVTAVSQGLTGDLRIAATSMLSTYVLPPVIKRFAGANPSVQFTLRTAPSDEVLDMVLRGTVHLGFGGILQHPDVEVLPLYEEEFLLAVHNRHPLAQAQSVSVIDLANETLIGLTTTAIHREFIENLKRHGGAPPRSTIDVDNPEASKQLVGQGIGIALFSRTAIARELENGTVKRIDLVDFPPMRRTMGALRLRPQSELSTVREFFALFCVQLRDMGIIKDTPNWARRRAGRAGQRSRTQRGRARKPA